MQRRDTVKTQFWKQNRELNIRVPHRILEYSLRECGLQTQPLKILWNFMKLLSNMKFHLKFHEISSREILFCISTPGPHSLPLKRVPSATEFLRSGTSTPTKNSLRTPIRVLMGPFKYLYVRLSGGGVWACLM